MTSIWGISLRITKKLSSLFCLLRLNKTSWVRTSSGCERVDCGNSFWGFYLLRRIIEHSGLQGVLQKGFVVVFERVGRWDEKVLDGDVTNFKGFFWSEYIFEVKFYIGQLIGTVDLGFYDLWVVCVDIVNLRRHWLLIYIIVDLVQKLLKNP